MPARAYAGSSYRARRPAARRPAARRRPGARRGASRIHWDRVGRIALTLVLAIILFSYIGPTLNLIHTYQGTTQAKAELRGLQHENDRLHRGVQSADHPAVLEREARRQGMVASGERSYVIIPGH